ncbi:MAG: glycosyltransferase [Thaumarchaeota archaeon]|nr:glycosyltransferase [Nitrososphaerota archaeon]
MKLCVFPNDPLRSYYEKGEIKKRYFNPKNMFKEVHVISLFDDDIDEEKVKSVAGEAKFQIYITGKVNLLNKRKMKKKVLEIIKKINPDVIRSYNPLLQGWMAAKIKQELGIPLVISLHGDYDRDLRFQSKKKHDYKSFLKLQISKRILEKFSLSNTDEVIIIYEFIRDYAESMGAKSINLIYNRIDLNQFSPDVTPAFKEKIPVIICVGRLIKEKNQECLIKAIEDLDVKLVLIGNGVEYENLRSLTKKLGIEHKVKFETSVPNSEIQHSYAAADIFALPIKYGGFAIPALEAAASGIPVILPKQEFDPNPDLVNKFAMFVDNNPKEFEKAISKVLSDSKMREKMMKDGLDTVKLIHSDIMEEKEKNLYLKVIKKN